eukprot:Nk52_evm7s219 gene=Nk52_evmTU7s219
MLSSASAVYLLIRILLFVSTAHSGSQALGRDSSLNHINYQPKPPHKKETIHMYNELFGENLCPTRYYCGVFIGDTLYMGQEIVIQPFLYSPVDDESVLFTSGTDLDQYLLDFNIHGPFLESRIQKGEIYMDDANGKYDYYHFPAGDEDQVSVVLNGGTGDYANGSIYQVDVLGDWNVVVTRLTVTLSSYKSIGSFFTNNYAQLKILHLTVLEKTSVTQNEEEYVGIVGTDLEESLLQGLHQLEELTIKVDRHWVAGTTDTRYARDLREMVANLLKPLKVEKLKKLVIDIPHGDLLDWDLDPFKAAALGYASIKAGLPPLSMYSQAMQPGLWMNVKPMWCGGDDSSMYFRQVCDSVLKGVPEGDKTWPGPNEPENQHSSARKNISSPAALDASNCPRPFVMHWSCPLLGSIRNAGLKNESREVRISGFVVNDYVVEWVNNELNLTSGNLYNLTIRKAEWLSRRPINIPLKHLNVSLADHSMPHSGNHSPLVFDLGGWCGSDGCGSASFDGAVGNMQPIIKFTPGVITGDGASLQNIALGIFLKRVFVDETLWEEIFRGRFSQNTCSLHVEAVGNMRLGEYMGSCKKSTGLGTESMLSMLEAIADPELPIPTGGFNVHLNQTVMSCFSNLKEIVIQNIPVNITGENIFPVLKRGVFRNNSNVNNPLNTIPIWQGEASEMEISFNPHFANGRGQRLVEELSHSNIDYLNISNNQLTFFNGNLSLQPCESDVVCKGLRLYDGSNNQVREMYMGSMYHLMSLDFYMPNATEAEALSYMISKRILVTDNQLVDVVFAYELPPPGVSSGRNRTVMYELWGGYREFTAEYSTLIKSEIDLSRNAFTLLRRNSFYNLPSLTVLNVSHCHIRTIESDFMAGDTCVGHGCFVDLSHNELGSGTFSLLGLTTATVSISRIDLSYNDFTSVPKGIGSLAQPREIVSPFKSPEESDSDHWFFTIHLSHNRITRLEESLCMGLNVDFQNVLYAYVDLSHNNITYISDKAFEGCGSANLYINVNNNPIRELPSDKEASRLIWLSAANTNVKRVRKFHGDARLYLRAIYISNGDDKMEYDCCGVYYFTSRGVVDVFNLDIDDISPPTAFALHTILHSLSVDDSARYSPFNLHMKNCTFKGHVMPFENFVNDMRASGIDVCASDETVTVSYNFFICTIAVYATLYFILICIACGVARWSGGLCKSCGTLAEPCTEPRGSLTLPYIEPTTLSVTDSTTGLKNTCGNYGEYIEPASYVMGYIQFPQYKRNVQSID